VNPYNGQTKRQTDRQMAGRHGGSHFIVSALLYRTEVMIQVSNTSGECIPATTINKTIHKQQSNYKDSPPFLFEIIRTPSQVLVIDNSNNVHPKKITPTFDFEGGMFIGSMVGLVAGSVVFGAVSLLFMLWLILKIKKKVITTCTTSANKPNNQLERRGKVNRGNTENSLMPSCEI
jgi:hypothetical protein